MDVKCNNLCFIDSNFNDSNWRRNLRTISVKEQKEPLPIYGVKTPEIEKNSR